MFSEGIIATRVGHSAIPEARDQTPDDGPPPSPGLPSLRVDTANWLYLF